MGEKLGEAVSLWGRGAWSPSNTMSLGPTAEAYLPTNTPQYTNVTDRTDRQDGQRSDSIGRTVLQPVAQSCDHVTGVTVYLSCVDNAG